MCAELTIGLDYRSGMTDAAALVMTIRHRTGLLTLCITLLGFAANAHAQSEPLPPPSPSPSPSPSAPAPPPAPSGPSVPVAAEPGSTSSMRLTYEATRVDRPNGEPAPTRSPDDYTFLHGFRIGYGYIMNYDQPSAALNGQSLKEKLNLRSPSHFLLGYEVVYRVVSHSWLNVILLANGEVAGLEQSKVLPSANLLIGAELKNTFQIGVGANLSPLAGSEAHTIIAAGWTPRVGTIYTPVHFFFIPDVDGNHRMGITTGVTF